MQQKGKAVLVDVREAKYYGKGHAGDCVNVGLFRSVEGRTPLDNLKRLAMAGFAMEATGTNISNRTVTGALKPFNSTSLMRKDSNDHLKVYFTQQQFCNQTWWCLLG